MSMGSSRHSGQKPEMASIKSCGTAGWQNACGDTAACGSHWIVGETSKQQMIFSLFFFYPGLRDTLGSCLLDQHFFFFKILGVGTLRVSKGLKAGINWGVDETSASGATGNILAIGCHLFLQ